MGLFKTTDKRRAIVDLRPLLYPLLLAAAVAGIFYLLCLGSFSIPAFLLNLGRPLTQRWGLELSFDSLRIGCRQNDCTFRADSGQIGLLLGDGEPVQIGLDRLEFCCPTSLAVSGLTFGSADQPHWLAVENLQANLQSREISASDLTWDAAGTPIQIGHVHFALQPFKAVVRDLHLPLESVSSQSHAQVGEIALDSIALPDSPGEPLSIAEVSLSGVRVGLHQTEDARPPSPPAASASADSLLPDWLTTLAERLEAIGESARRDLLRFLIVWTAFLFLLKLGFTASRGWRTGFVLAALAVIPPFLIYFLLGNQASFLLLLGIAVAASALIALIFWQRDYVQGTNWFKRWVPVGVDLISPSILIFLLLYGFDFEIALPQPSGIEVERIAASDQIVVDRSYRECQSDRFTKAEIGGFSVQSLKAFRSQGPDRLLNIEFSPLEISAARIKQREGEENDLWELLIAPAIVEDVRLGLAQDGQPAGALQATLETAGRFHPTRLQRRLQDLGGRSEGAEDPLDVGFAARINLTGPGEASAVSQAPPSAQAETDWIVWGNVAIDLSSEPTSFGARAYIRRPPVGFELAAQGDLEAIEIMRLQSIPESRLQIAQGSGRLTLGDQLEQSIELNGLATTLENVRLAVDRIQAGTVLQSSCESTKIAIDADLQGTSFSREDRSSAMVRQIATLFNFGLQGSQADYELRSELLGLTLEGRRQDGGEAWLNADLARLAMTLKGGNDPDDGAHRIDSKLSLEASLSESPQDQESVVFRTEEPLPVATDLSQRTVRISQASSGQSPQAGTPFQFEVGARLASLTFPRQVEVDGFLKIPELELRVPSAQTRIEDLELAAQLKWQQGEPSGRVSLGSGWSSVTRSGLLGELCLGSIPGLDLAGRFQSSRLAFGEASSPIQDDSSAGAERQANPLCLPPSSSQAGFFQLKGGWSPAGEDSFLDLQIRQGSRWRLRFPDAQDSDLRVQRDSGPGIRIAEVRPERLRLKASEALSLQLQSEGLGIRTLDRSGNLSLRSGLLIASGRTAIELNLQDSEKSLIETHLEAGADQLSLTVPSLSTAQAWTGLEPFLNHFEISTQGILPRARIRRLHAKALISEEAVSQLSSTLEIESGPLLSLDLPRLQGDEDSSFSQIDLALTGADGARFEFLAQGLDGPQASFQAAADLAGLSARAEDRQGENHQIDLNLNAALEGGRDPQAAGANPALQRMAGAWTEVGALLEGGSRLFRGGESGRAIDLREVSAEFRLGNPGPAKPLLNFDNDAVSLNLDTQVSDLRWTASEGGTTSLNGSASLALLSHIHQGHLVLDGFAPLRLERISEADNQPLKIELDLPLLLALKDRLEKGTPDPGHWGSEYFQPYAEFWRGYSVVNAANGFSPFIERDSLTAGPVAFGQFTLPDAPLRLAIGLSDGNLQIHAPFLARLLFGRAEGLIDAELEPAGDDLLIRQLNAGLAVRDLQAGAIGLASPSGVLPFVEDRLDADFRISPGEIRLSRDLLQALQTDPINPQLLDGLDLTLSLRSSAGEGLAPEADQPRLMPGIFQLSLGLEIDFFNDLLNRLANAVLLLFPPPGALRYQQMEFQLAVQDGLLQGDLPLMRLQGLRFPAEDQPEITTDLTVYWGGPAGQVLQEGYTLLDLLRYLSRGASR